MTIVFEGWHDQFPCGRKYSWRYEYPHSPGCGTSFLPTESYRFMPMPDPEHRQHHRKKNYLTDYCSPCQEWFIVLREKEQKRQRHGI